MDQHLAYLLYFEGKSGKAFRGFCDKHKMRSQKEEFIYALKGGYEPVIQCPSYCAHVHPSPIDLAFVVDVTRASTLILWPFLCTQDCCPFVGRWCCVILSGKCHGKAMKNMCDFPPDSSPSERIIEMEDKSEET